MKRTRRVEVIRYRRFTVVSNESALEPDLSAEEAAIDVLLGIPCTNESPTHDASGAEQQVDSGGGAGLAQRYRPSKLLRRLIRG